MKAARAAAASQAATSTAPPSTTPPCALAHARNSAGSHAKRSRASSVTSVASPSSVRICGRSAHTRDASGIASSMSTNRVDVAPTMSR